MHEAEGSSGALDSWKQNKLPQYAPKYRVFHVPIMQCSSSVYTCLDGFTRCSIPQSTHPYVRRVVLAWSSTFTEKWYSSRLGWIRLSRGAHKWLRVGASVYVRSISSLEWIRFRYRIFLCEFQFLTLYIHSSLRPSSRWPSVLTLWNQLENRWDLGEWMHGLRNNVYRVRNSKNMYT